MPFRRQQVTPGGLGYGNPWVDGPRDVEQITVDLSDLTTAEVDAKGYLKPGVLLKADGTLADAAAGEFIYGATIEPVYVGADPIGADADLDALTDIQVAVGRSGLLNRDIVEDNLGRALTAAELAAITAAGSRLAITAT